MKLHVEDHTVYDHRYIPLVSFHQPLHGVFFGSIGHGNVQVQDNIHVDAHELVGLPGIPIREVEELKEASHRQSTLRLGMIVGRISLSDAWEPKVQLVGVQLNGGS